MRIKAETVWEAGLVFSMVSLNGQVEVSGATRIFINLVTTVAIVFVINKIKGGEK